MPYNCSFCGLIVNPHLTSLCCYRVLGIDLNDTFTHLNSEYLPGRRKHSTRVSVHNITRCFWNKMSKSDYLNLISGPINNYQQQPSVPLIMQRWRQNKRAVRRSFQSSEDTRTDEPSHHRNIFSVSCLSPLTPSEMCTTLSAWLSLR